MIIRVPVRPPPAIVIVIIIILDGITSSVQHGIDSYGCDCLLSLRFQYKCSTVGTRKLREPVKIIELRQQHVYTSNHCGACPFLGFLAPTATTVFMMHARISSQRLQHATASGISPFLPEIDFLDPALNY